MNEVRIISNKPCNRPFFDPSEQINGFLLPWVTSGLDLKLGGARPRRMASWFGQGYGEGRFVVGGSVGRERRL